MSEHAYDISYLLESETALPEVSLLRAAKVAPMAPPDVCNIAAAQEALASELLQIAEFHDNWICQYTRV
jgi:hypothetical protein